MAQSSGTLLSPRERRRVARPRQSVPRAALVATRTRCDEDEEAEQLKPTFLEVCWPTLFGLLLAVIADRLRIKVDTVLGAIGDRLVFPWVQIASRPDLGLGVQTETVSKMVLQLQFPLTGLFASFSLSRGKRMFAVVMEVLFAYGLAAFVLWLLTQPGITHRM